MKRVTVARGVYRDPYGHEVRWRDFGLPHRKRFPLDTPLDHLKAFRHAQPQRAGGRDEGSFPRDAVRFLKTRRHLPSFPSDRAHLRPWIHRFRRLARWAVTHEHIAQALQEWAARGYSTRTLRHRLRVLTALYHALDPGVAQIPPFGVKVPKGRQAPLQRRPTDETITAVARQLRLQEMPGIGRLRDSKTRARFLVLVTTGIRPAQVKRALPIDLDLEQRLWVVHPAKGDKGTIIYLNDDMLRAVQLFIAADAWGAFDGRSFVKTLQRNGWPKGIRPYNVRHAVGQTLRRRGARLEEIGDHLGHRSIATTRQFYVQPEIAQLKATSERLDGRLQPELFAPRVTHAPDTPARTRKAKGRENRPHLANGPRAVETADPPHAKGKSA